MALPAATKVNPGDNVTYTIQINATVSDATGVTLTDPTAANTSEVAGSLNVTPVALNDTYPQNVAANMTVNTATSGFTVVTNDYPGILAGNPVALSALTITTSGTSANGGLVSMTTSGANVGRFVYSAPPGFTGTDTFTYMISNGVAGTPAGSATGTVTMNVVGPVIWFVDDSAPAGGNGTWTGTNSKAFQTVTQAAAVDAANHRIYLASGTYANGISLNADEWVVGEGASGASFDAVMGTSYGTDTPGRPAVGGTRPAWTAAAGSNVVFLANNNTILGVAITGSTVTAVQGTNVTTGLIGNAATTRYDNRERQRNGRLFTAQRWQRGIQRKCDDHFHRGSLCFNLWPRDRCRHFQSSDQRHRNGHPARQQRSEWSRHDHLHRWTEP